MTATTERPVPLRVHRTRLTDRRLEPRRRKALASERPAHAARSPADQPTPHVPHNVPCPVCRASVGASCKGRQGRTGTTYAHVERRVLAGKARRAQVYGLIRDPRIHGWHHGIALVLDSLADDPRYAHP